MPIPGDNNLIKQRASENRAKKLAIIKKRTQGLACYFRRNFPTAHKTLKRTARTRRTARMQSPAHLAALLLALTLSLLLASHAPRACARGDAAAVCWQYNNDVRRYACPVNFRVARVVGALLAVCAPCAPHEIADGNGRACHACSGSWFIRPSRANFFSGLGVGAARRGAETLGAVVTVRGQEFQCR